MIELYLDFLYTGPSYIDFNRKGFYHLKYMKSDIYESFKLWNNNDEYIFIVGNRPKLECFTNLRYLRKTFMLKTLIAQKKLCKYLQHKKTSGI